MSNRRPIEPFFPPEEMAALRAGRRARRVQGVKNVLKILQEAQLHGLPSDDDAALDVLAERLYVAFFEV